MDRRPDLHPVARAAQFEGEDFMEAIFHDPAREGLHGAIGVPHDGRRRRRRKRGDKRRHGPLPETQRRLGLVRLQRRGERRQRIRDRKSTRLNSSH